MARGGPDCKPFIIVQLEWQGYDPKPHQKKKKKWAETLSHHIDLSFLPAALSNHVLRLTLEIFSLSKGPRGCQFSFIPVFLRLKCSQLKFQKPSQFCFLAFLSSSFHILSMARLLMKPYQAFLALMIIWGIGIINFLSLWIYQWDKSSQRKWRNAYVTQICRFLWDTYHQHASLGED